MAVTGVLLNHPDSLAGFDLPRAWLPGDYAYRQGSRNGLRGAVTGPDGARFLFGEAGVWRVAAGGTPQALDQGLPRGAYRRDTRALVWVDGPAPFLVAGTRGGVFARPAAAGEGWQPVLLGGGAPPVVDVVRAGDRVLAVTRDRVYAAPAAWPLTFRDATPPRADAGQVPLPLFRLIFHGHSGAAWGLAGRLAVDAIGVLLLGFTVTGVWFGWRRWRGTLARGRGGRWARRGLGWHVKLGGWCAVPLLLVALTGLFQRPPLLVAVAAVTYPARWHPAPRPANPWHDLLRKAAYDPLRDELLLATADGFYRGPADGSAAFEPVASSPPVSVMGATVLRRNPGGLYWVGSMSGLYLWDPVTGQVTDAFTGQPPRRSFGPPVGDHAVSGLLAADRGPPLAVDYFQGVIDARGRPAPVVLPEELRGGGRISLWHALFEVHNGRIFGFALGWWSWVVVPLGGLALTAEIVSGWIAHRRRRRR